MFNFLSR